MDIWGPIGTHSLDGFNIFFTIVNYFTRYILTFFMHAKSETITHIENLINYSLTQFSCKIKTICSDNGNEFLMTSYYAYLGIVHQRSYVETPQENSTIERKHIHLLNVIRSLLFHANLSKCVWSFSLCHATYLINKLCTPTIHHHTPYELLLKESPNLTHLKLVV